MRILIVKMSSLGDIVQAFPVLDYFKERRPQCQIDWVVEEPFSQLVKAHPFVDRTILANTKRWRSQLLQKLTWKEIGAFRNSLRQMEYDLVLDLQGNSKSAIATSWAKSRLKVGFDFASVPEWPNLFATNKRTRPPSGKNIREDYLFLAQFGLEEYTPIRHAKGIKLITTEDENEKLQQVLSQGKCFIGKNVLVCPGSNWSNKQLSNESLRVFLESFQNEFHVRFLFIWGNQPEREVAEKLVQAIPHSLVIERLSLPCLQNLMSQVDLVLSMDSLPLHLAGTTSTPTYSVFGPSLAQKYSPTGNSLSYQGVCPYGITFDKRCPHLRKCKTGACMKQIQGDQLYRHFREWYLGIPA